MKPLLFLAFLFCSGFLFGQFEIDDSNYTVEELVSEVLINSNCAETSNYEAFTGTAQNINGIGYFNANGADFPFEEGIVLSTGRAIEAVGPNLGINDSGEEGGWAGDDELRAITNTNSLYNATFIKFDFIPVTNRISFNFLFASEEYQEYYQCIYSDVFAFILTDSNGVSNNLAIIPGTDLPVRATTIRPGIDGECGAMNLDYFDKINDRASAISFHGQTKSLTAESDVNPGEKYSIKLVISDNQDSQVDSAVFLEGGSFSLGIDLGIDRTVADGNPACLGETIPVNAAVEGAQSYIWYQDGVEKTEWLDQAQVELVETGAYSVEVVFSATCVADGNLNVEFIDPPQISEEPIDLTACDVDSDGSEVFDFTANERLVLGDQDGSIYKVTYYNSEADAQAFTNAISNPTNYLATESKTVFARVSSQRSCYALASFQLDIQAFDVDLPLQQEYVLCLDNEGNSLDPLPLLDTGLSNADYSFRWYSESIAPENLIAGADSPFLSVDAVGEYFIEIENLRFGCSFSLSTSVKFSKQPELFDIVFVSDLFTDNNIVEILAEGDSEYLFSLDDGPFTASNRFENLSPGEHFAVVTDVDQCSMLRKEFLVVDFPRFFTPNGDGSNDTWNIVGFREIEDAQISIFDKYGALQYQFDQGGGWDGTIHGNDAPSSDYWFKITYVRDNVQKEFKSHFALKR